MKKKHITIAAIVLLFTVPLWANDAENALSNLSSRLSAGASIEEKSTLAILPFEVSAGLPLTTGRAVAEYLVAVFQSNPIFQLVDRIQFSKAMEEVALSQTGAMSETSALAIGQAVAARYLITGTIHDALGKAMITANLVEAETGKIISSANVSIPAEMLGGFSKELLGEKGQLSASLFRSMLIPGWGQFYTSHPLRGGFSLGLFLAGAALTTFGIAQSVQAGNDYDDFIELRNTVSGEQQLIEEYCGTSCTKTSPQFDQNEFNAFKKSREDNLYSTYEDTKRLSVIFGAVWGGIWVLNVVDASIAGAQSKKKFDLYFSVSPDKTLQSRIVYLF